MIKGEFFDLDVRMKIYRGFRYTVKLPNLEYVKKTHGNEFNLGLFEFSFSYGKGRFLKRY